MHTVDYSNNDLLSFTFDDNISNEDSSESHDYSSAEADLELTSLQKEWNNYLQDAHSKHDDPIKWWIKRKMVKIQK